MNSSIFLNGSPININGGYRHPEKGFQVEINLGDKGVKSIPFSNIAFLDMPTAENIFIQIFGMTFNEAKARSRANFMPKLLGEEDCGTDKLISLEEIPKQLRQAMIFDPYEEEIN